MIYTQFTSYMSIFADKKQSTNLKTIIKVERAQSILYFFFRLVRCEASCSPQGYRLALFGLGYRHCQKMIQTCLILLRERKNVRKEIWS